MISAREAAYRSLIKCEQSGSYSNIEIDAKIKKYGLEGAEKGLYTALVYGVIERKLTLDYYLSKYVKGDYDKLDTSLVITMRIGAYQLLFMDRIPQSAAVNEATEMARRNAPHGAHNMANAVLRELCRQKENLPSPTNRLDKLSIEHSVPREIIELWEHSYGEDTTKRILMALNSKPPVTLRINNLKTTANDICDTLKSRQVPFVPLGDSIVLKGSLADCKDLLDSGLCFVQDLSSTNAVYMLSPTPGSTLIDTCACPGGKSFASAMMMDGMGKIYSFDLHKNKLSLIEKTAEKLGITNITIAENDAKKPLKDLEGKADYVVCDVPCSGLGVIAKKPEIRYKDLGSITRLPELQYEILCSSVSYLKSGAKILYSTCTLNRAENDNVVDKFLSEHPEYRELSRNTFYPDGISDGFFACVIEKE